MKSSPPSPPVGPAAAAQELLNRRNARKRLLHFTNYTFPGYETNWHHAVLCDYLDRFATGEIKRLMVFMPPRHGKSELVSRRLPAYILGLNPDAQVIATSYGADLAQRMNRDVQRIIDSDAYRRLFPDTQLYGSNVRTVAQGAYLRNSDIFEVVNQRGAYRSAGTGGGITGMGFNFGIIDDPIKERGEADSKTYREALWDWYVSTFYTRQETDASILITMTRWHDDDLCGHLLNLAQADPEQDQWTVVCFPALGETDHPLHMREDLRADGEPLWPAKKNHKALKKIKALSAYEWAALWQQRPRLREGGMFQAAWFKIVAAAPVQAKRVRYWDKAGSDGRGANTAGVLMSETPGKLIFVEDVVTGQWSAGKRNRMMHTTAESDAAKHNNRVRIFHEQEPGSGGKESAESTNRLLAGHPVRADRATGDKDTRLDPFAAQAEAGNVYLVKGPWNAAYIEELCAVPNGLRRDQADASAGAYNKLQKPTMGSGRGDFSQPPPKNKRGGKPSPATRTPEEIERLLDE